MKLNWHPGKSPFYSFLVTVRSKFNHYLNFYPYGYFQLIFLQRNELPHTKNVAHLKNLKKTFKYNLV